MGRPGGMREAIEHLNIYLFPLPPALDVAPILKVGIEELWHIFCNHNDGADRFNEAEHALACLPRAPFPCFANFPSQMTFGISFREHLATEAAIEDDVRRHRVQ